MKGTRNPMSPAKPLLLLNVPRNLQRVGRESGARSRLHFLGCVTAPLCKRVLSTRYASANSNRSAPSSDSSAWNRTSEIIMFCTREPRRSSSTGTGWRSAARGRPASHAASEDGLRRRKGLVRLKGEDPIYAARAIFPHLAGREIKLDARKTLGICRFSSNLPADFGLRAVIGYLPEGTARYLRPGQRRLVLPPCWRSGRSSKKSRP